MTIRAWRVVTNHSASSASRRRWPGSFGIGFRRASMTKAGDDKGRLGVRTNKPATFEVSLAFYQFVGTIERRNTPQDAASHTWRSLLARHKSIASRQPYPSCQKNVAGVACRIEISEQICESITMRECNHTGAQTLTHAAHAAQSNPWRYIRVGQRLLQGAR